MAGGMFICSIPAYSMEGDVHSCIIFIPANPASAKPFIIPNHYAINYLAHAYLSFNDTEILTGNMISDFVKGKKQFDFPLPVQRGITWHRRIDEFTDFHPATKEAKEVFRPYYRLYSGAVVDVVYDHFLATDANEFTAQSLFDFSMRVYEGLDQQSHLFPEKFAAIFPYMKQFNWLYNYRTHEGTSRSLQGLARRAQYMPDTAVAFQLFTDHYQLLKDCYRHFWTGMKSFAEKEFNKTLLG